MSIITRGYTDQTIVTRGYGNPILEFIKKTLHGAADFSKSAYEKLKTVVVYAKLTHVNDKRRIIKGKVVQKTLDAFRNTRVKSRLISSTRNIFERIHITVSSVISRFGSWD